MDTKTMFYGLILVASVIACSTVEQDFKDDVLISNEQQEVIISATVESQPETRTVLGDDYLSVLWKPEDEIKVFSAGEASRFTSQNTGNEKAVNFKGMISVITGTAEGAGIDTHIYGLYPYMEDATMSEGSFTTELPSVQTGLADSFDDDLFISIGRSYTFSMGFWNVCSGYRFSFTEDGYQSVTLSSNDGTPLAGTFVVTFDGNGKPVIISNPTPSSSVTVNAPEGGFVANTWYYIVVLPGTHEDGYTFTATNASGIGTYVVTDPNKKTFNRSRFKQIARLDEYLVYSQPNNEIWYTTADGTELSYLPDVYSLYDLNDDENYEFANCISNTYSNGIGKLVYDSDIVALRYYAMNRTNCTSIILPESLHILTSYAFHSCPQLESITFLGDLDVVYAAPIQYCPKLKKINGNNVFSWKGQDLLVSKGVLKAVAPVSITSLNLLGCNSVSSIGSGCCSGFRNLETIILSSGITTIEDDAFNMCTKVVTVDLSGTSIRDINDGAFGGCSSLETVRLPETLVNIGESAFVGDGKLTDIDFPSSLRYIAAGAFKDTGLTEVTLPSSVSVVGDEAFYSASIQKVVVGNNTPADFSSYYIDESSEIGSPFRGSYPIYVPQAYLSDYLNDFRWSQYSSRLKAADIIAFADPLVKSICVSHWDTNNDGELSYAEAAAVESIGTYFQAERITTFNEFKAFTGITSVPESAFYGCDALKSIYIPDGVRTIEDYAFDGALELSTLHVPNSLRTIGNAAFAATKKLKSFVFPNTVVSIGDVAFRGSGLSRAILPETMTYLGFGVFESCASLKTVSLPNNLSVIDDSLFRESGIEEIRIPATVRRIAFGAFLNCTSLKKVYCYPATPPEMEMKVFDGMTGFKIFVRSTEIKIEYRNTPGWCDYSDYIVVSSF